MKYFLMVIIFFNADVCLGQNSGSVPLQQINLNNRDENIIWTKVEKEAEFPGGIEGWKNFLIKNLRSDTVANYIYMPDSIKSITHTVILKFIVGKDGSLSDIAVEKSTNSYCSLEALRVIKLSPSWIPGYQNGRAVNCYRRQPISFVFTQE
jgi:periplasmic protein TonB